MDYMDLRRKVKKRVNAYFIWTVLRGWGVKDGVSHHPL